jgi:phosphoglycerate dehydrogenase-like enzyme
MSRFRVGLTRDFIDPQGRPVFGDIGLGALDAEPGISWGYLPEFHPEIVPDQLRGLDAIITLRPRYTARSFEGGDGRLALVARFGVGYDNVDVGALTAHDVALAIAPEGVRRPVASAIVLFMLALAHQLPAKERLLRSGRWRGPCDVVGVGLTGRTVGIVGLGNIGLELCDLLRPFGLRQIASDPHVAPAFAAERGVTLLPLEDLLRESDFVCINCPLTPTTKGLIGGAQLALMKPTAFLVNTARGAIVDQAALTLALAQRRIRGAALDVFQTEPLPPDDPLLALDNVILTPHAVCITDEVALGNGRGAIEAVLAVARGEAPRHLVNGRVLDRPGFREKLSRHRSNTQGGSI